MTDPALSPGTVEQIVRRAGRPDFDRWAEQVERCGHCARPVRLRGRVTTRDPDGRRRDLYSTDREPDRVLLVRCGNRRASVCPSCSREYAGDMWQLLYAGAAGGRKGVPETVRAHPLVFATLTAPSFGPVHGIRTGRNSSTGRCRPPRGKPQLCPHGRPNWCNRIHTDDDPRLGQPLCEDCYDYPGHVAFNWHAPELWRRFTITLRRILARRAGVRVGDFPQLARLSFVKVAEFQRRGVVHFHALIRLDGPGDYATPLLPIDAATLAAAIEESAAAIRLTVELPATGQHPQPAPAVPHIRQAPTTAHPGQDADRHPVTVPRPHADQRSREEAGRDDRASYQPPSSVPPLPDGRPSPTTDTHRTSIPAPGAVTLRFGTQTDVQPVNDDTDGQLTSDRVASYIAKYATKSAEDFGLGGHRITPATLPYLGLSRHVETIVRTAWELGAHPDYVGLRRWLHMAGFRGHFASKSRRYSTTLGAIRRERRIFRQRQAAEHARQLGELDDTDTTLVVARWKFTGIGYLNSGDAALALSAAARARERREAARDAINRLETERAALP
jgi:hypothetical protein